MVSLLSIGCIGFLFVSIFVINSVVKSVVVKELQAVFQSEVEVGSARLSLNPVGVVVNDLKFVDSDKVALFQFESSQIKLSLQVSELFNGRFIIDEMMVLDVKTAYKQSKKRSRYSVSSPSNETAILDPEHKHQYDYTSGSLSDFLVSDTELSGKVQSLSLLDQLTLDKEKLVDYVSLESDQQALLKIHDSIQKLTESLQEVDLTTVDFVRADIADLKEKASKLNQAITSKRNYIQRQYKDRHDSVSSLDSYFESDFQRLKEMIRLDSYQSGNLSETLLYHDFSDYVSIYSYYSRLASRLIHNLSSVDKMNHVASVQSESNTVLPRIWIKKLVFSDSDNAFSVKILNLSSNQSLLDTPVRFQFNDAKKQIFASYFVGNILTQVYSVTYFPFSLKSHSLYNDGENQVMLDSATQDIAANFEIIGRNLDGNVYFNTTSLAVSGDDLDRLSVSGLIYDTLKDSDSVVIKAGLSGSILSPAVSISSDFDAIVKDRFNDAMSIERDRQIQLLQEAITLRMELEKSMLLSTIEEQYSAWLNTLDVELSRMKFLEDSIVVADKDSLVIKEQLEEARRQEIVRQQREEELALELEKKRQAEALALEEAKQAAILLLDDSQVVESANMAEQVEIKTEQVIESSLESVVDVMESVKMVDQVESEQVVDMMESAKTVEPVESEQAVDVFLETDVNMMESAKTVEPVESEQAVDVSLETDVDVVESAEQVESAQVVDVIESAKTVEPVESEQVVDVSLETDVDVMESAKTVEPVESEQAVDVSLETDVDVIESVDMLDQVELEAEAAVDVSLDMDVPVIDSSVKSHIESVISTDNQQNDSAMGYEKENQNVLVELTQN